MKKITAGCLSFCGSFWLSHLKRLRPTIWRAASTPLWMLQKTRLCHAAG